MKICAALLALAAVSVSARDSHHPFLRKLQGASCDLYCANAGSDFCTDSPLADLSIRYPKPDGFVGDNTEYAKCYIPWEGDGQTVKVRCPPTIEETPISCQQCGYSWSAPNNAPGAPGSGAPFSTIAECCPGVVDADGYRYTFNYDWNKEKAKRSSYPSEKGSCWAWWGCDSGYECADRRWWGKGTCKLSSNSKFLGEKCSDNTQCNQVTSAHVAMACARVSKTCLLKEDADRQHSLAGLSRKQCSCSIFDHWDIRSTFTGLISCVNYKDCGGAECTLTTRDGNKYCHHTDASNAKCSNCRTADNACK